MKAILLLILIAANCLHASTPGTLANDTQVPLVMDGKTVGSMTLKAGAAVTIVQILPDNQVLISRGDSNTFKVSKESLTPESLAVASAIPTTAPVPAPTVAPTISAPTPTVNSSNIPYLSQPSEAINFLKAEGINPDMVKSVGIMIDPKAKVTVTTVATDSVPSATGNIEYINYIASKGYDAKYSLNGIGISIKSITPDSLAAAQEELKKNICRIEIILKAAPDLQVVLSKDISAGTTADISKILIQQEDGIVKKKYVLACNNDHKVVDSSYITPDSLAKALASRGPFYENKSVMKDQIAADQGNVDAQLALGLRYENGDGVEKSFTEAMKWYQKAADQGNPDAQRNLAFCYANGTGVKTDDRQAVTWFRKAADQGNSDTQFALAWRYEHGQTVPKNLIEASKWYQKAADQGNADAQRNLNELKAKNSYLK